MMFWRTASGGVATIFIESNISNTQSLITRKNSIIFENSKIVVGGLEPSIKATIIFMFEKYNAHSRRHNDIVYLSLCRVQTDVSREQEIQFIIIFFDLLL